ncbi:VID27-domain-containing protein [Trichodelitschia bisporula]|uniref:VID27-domain-containing protein n=1 Tax=Trichodelitschia bisporula TaxID=703511 RepID=A0A6G1I2N8_9PEZI|nr:VID27-domain-containing protein [Trichodelitschia bisporula]
MFMINRLGKWFFGDSSKESLIEIPEGQLYIVRPLSPKGYSELIYKDARAAIRRTGTEFNFQLVITRAYEEGEEDLLAEEEGADTAEDILNQDEQVFLLDESLQFRVDIRNTGEKVFAWKDLSGSNGDLWEFVCDFSTDPDIVGTFELAALRCQFERKYRKSSEEATEEQLHEFVFADEPIPTASPLLSPSKSRSPTLSPSPTSTRLQADAASASRDSMAPKALVKAKEPESKQLVAPESAEHPEHREILAREVAQLHLFDFESGTFILQDDAVEAVVVDLGNWDYWLKVTGQERSWLGRTIEDDINPVFNFEFLSAIFNVYGRDNSAHSWLLRFKDQASLEQFQQGLMQALWEHTNQTRWLKLKDNDREYVLDAFQDLALEDQEGEPHEEEEEEEEEDEEDGENFGGRRSEKYDSDESEDDVTTRDNDGNVNSQLAVGYKHDRSFVVRGSKIGVFKHTEDNHLEFATNISKVQTPKGKLFSPKKIMLHAGDRDMILQNTDNPNSVYRMDLEVGKVVDEWKIHEDIPITTFAPETKFAQMTDQQTFLGLSNNAMYRVDPRLTGNKLVESNMKSYASKTGFTTAATTDKGYIAIGSANGDVRLFDRLGVIAKTALPALGDPIIGLDVSADGRWLLATTRTYLLLVDTLQKDGKFEGKLGFERSFPKDSKPQPRRLALSPNHVAQFQHETKAPISFTPAKFNTGPDTEETTIVTATGPFIISWSMKKLLRGVKDPYSIKRYSEVVKADNFRFNSDKGIIVALPNEVDMVKRAALKRPTRESIAATPRMSAGGRRSTRGYLGRSDIVNSPY